MIRDSRFEIRDWRGGGGAIPYCLALLFAVFVYSICGIAAETPLEIAEGWRLPNDSDLIEGWARFRNLPEKPFHVRADFNGDGVFDDAYLAFSLNTAGWALFANLNSKTASPRILKLTEDPGKNIPRSMGVSVVEAGNYATVCGKGYRTCKPGEPRELILKLPAIELHAFEGASSYFWWDPKSSNFCQTWISD